jgi:geranylgeranyl pyrophosphate synthase
MANGQKIDLDGFFDATRIDVDKKINDTIRDKQIISALEGGKRLRSMLAHLSFKTCTEGKETFDQYNKALEGTVSIELAHSASLVHDDIIDNDVERRGKKAAHVNVGIGKALLLGHKMLTEGFRIALSHGKEVANLYVESWNEVVNGEIDEVEFNKNGHGAHVSTKEQIFAAYNKIIDMKTAALFSSACKAGALEADMAGDILRVFGDYGREIGLAYQLADDLVDLAHGEMIDSVVIPLLNKIDKKTQKISIFKRREIKRLFAKNKDKIQEFYLDEIKKHVKKAEELGKSDIIPKSSYKDILIEAPTYIINMMLSEIDIAI